MSPVTPTQTLHCACLFDGERIVDSLGRVSRVTTAGAAPSVGAYLLMAYLPPEHAVRALAARFGLHPDHALLGFADLLEAEEEEGLPEEVVYLE